MCSPIIHAVETIGSCAVKAAFSKPVRYGSHAIAFIPGVNFFVGAGRISTQLFLAATGPHQSIHEKLIFRKARLIQGAFELIPILGPAGFWILYWAVKSVKACSNLCVNFNASFLAPAQQSWDVGETRAHTYWYSDLETLKQKISDINPPHKNIKYIDIHIQIPAGTNKKKYTRLMNDLDEHLNELYPPDDKNLKASLYADKITRNGVRKAKWQSPK